MCGLDSFDSHNFMILYLLDLKVSNSANTHYKRTSKERLNKISIKICAQMSKRTLKLEEIIRPLLYIHIALSVMYLLSLNLSNNIVCFTVSLCR